MTDKNRADAWARGQALRSARVARARSIRRRIVAGSVALFVAAWLMIAIMLVSGHDPALASKSSASKTSSATTLASTPSTPSTTTTTTATTASSGSATTSSGSGTGGGGVSSVTTSQS